MREIAGRLATAATLPLVLDSTEPAVIEAGLELIGGRSVVNSVNYEDGDGPDSRIARLMPLIREHGAAVVALTIDEQGQARTAEWKVEVAERLIHDLTDELRDERAGHHRRLPHLPDRHRPGGDQAGRASRPSRRSPSSSAAIPTCRRPWACPNVSFGLKPAARQVLNSVFLAECVKAGLDSAIVHPSKIVPLARIPDEQREVALDLVYDRRRPGYDPLARMLDLFEGVDAVSAKADAGRRARRAAAGGAAEAADHRRRAQRP